MAREFAKSFYHSKAWKHTRDVYAKDKMLCEPCLAKGKYVKGEIVHHIEHLTPANINDPSVTLSFDNLQLVCRDCHAKEHPEIYGRDSGATRCRFDKNGDILPLGDEDDDL